MKWFIVENGSVASVRMWMAVLLAGALAVSGCRATGKEKAAATAVATESAVPATAAAESSASMAAPSAEPEADVQSAPASTPAVETSLPSEPIDPPPTDVPAEFLTYYDFVDGRSLGKLAFHLREDLDLDGKDEIILAFGSLGDPYEDDVTNLYILHDDNGTLSKSGDDWAHEGAYATYDVQIVRLQDSPKKYLYLGKTNNASMTGFNLIAFNQSVPSMLTANVSATGSGDDELTDDDQDGAYDGYVSYRGSYDVFYYEFEWKFAWLDGKFVHQSTHADVGEYPETIQNVILEYLAMRLLADEGAPEIETRLAELCADETAAQVEIRYDDWTDTLRGFVGEPAFQIEEDGDTAAVVAAVGDQPKLHFGLARQDGRWVIDELRAA